MKIVDINFYHYETKFKVPVITPKVTMTSRKVLLIELITEKQNHYFGESNAFETAWYTNETIEIVQTQAELWYSKYKNRTFDHFSEIQSALDDLYEYPSTRNTLMMACYPMFHDLHAFHVPYGATLNGLTEETLRQLSDTKPERVKIKWTANILNDIATVKNLPADIQITVDANESLNLNQAAQLKALIDERILYIEEPFKSLEQLNHFNEHDLPPIAIDEKATSDRAIIDAIEQYEVDVVVLKPFRLGGIDKTLTIIEILKRKNIKFVIGGMYEYGLSRYFTAMLAQYADYPSDITPEGYYFENDIVQYSGILKGGSIYFEPPKVDMTQLGRIIS
ncbi:o-succinylbenzoate synthase [Staphylococcus caeli]|uniref:o-succinylbenzoate synthase n=1 Tax=Staphylococcus caeli TaxID=2201815 RepID=A0A1D4HAF7_9STAP|nr:o-succinylbenzoate synthase [Staphylococcus caeli]SCS34131.1 O-succinylbenzoic acid synthetase [Staphylococcus caeli]SCS61524.1 O-succinylbenzoic acid synthetase [Staphylococcus caeli]